MQPARGAADRGIEERVNALLRRMNLDEKLQQIQLLSDGQVTKDDARKGVGSVFSLVDPEKINALQHVAVEESRLGIPILFAYDTIHGYRTIFPAPLGAASSFDPVGGDGRPHDRGARVRPGRVEADLQPDGRRLPRAALGPDRRGRRRGPVPELRVRGRAREGRPGDRLLAADKVVTSVKHYAAYGEPEGGRDYNTTDMSERRLRDLYLPPFKAAIDAGADTVMCSFNSLNGVPGCANKYIETDILKNEWGFDGFIESDYTAVAETRACPPVNPSTGPCGHGTAADGPEAGANALNAGTDSEMVSTLIRDHGGSWSARADLHGAPRRRGAPHPAHQVPRRSVRAPYVDVDEGARRGELRHPGRPGGGP